MKTFIAISAFCICILLVIFSATSLEAARTGVDIWWNTLLPTLFPFFACATLMERSGALHSLANLLIPVSKRLKLSYYALPLLILGGLTGYPSGARLCGMLCDDIGEREAQRLGTICNLCSPMFLAGAVSAGMFKSTSVFAPLAIGHYGGAIITALLLKIIAPIAPSKPRRMLKGMHEPFSRLLPRTLSDCMADISKVGGSVIFFIVLADLMNQTGIVGLLGAPIDMLFKGASSPSHGIILGILEMTGGCHAIANSALPRVISVPICAFLVSFGGLSVMVQAMAFVSFKRPLNYLLIKLFHAFTAAAIAYVIVVNSPNSAEVFNPSGQSYATNALSGLTTLFACALGVGSAFVFSLMVGRNKRA